LVTARGPQGEGAWDAASFCAAAAIGRFPRGSLGGSGSEALRRRPGTVVTRGSSAASFACARACARAAASTHNARSHRDCDVLAQRKVSENERWLGVRCNFLRPKRQRVPPLSRRPGPCLSGRPGLLTQGHTFRQAPRMDDLGRRRECPEGGRQRRRVRPPPSSMTPPRAFAVGLVRRPGSRRLELCSDPRDVDNR